MACRFSVLIGVVASCCVSTYGQTKSGSAGSDAWVHFMAAVSTSTEDFGGSRRMARFS